jgi:hypothetical protein
MLDPIPNDISFSYVKISKVKSMYLQSIQCPRERGRFGDQSRCEALSFSTRKGSNKPTGQSLVQRPARVFQPTIIGKVFWPLVRETHRWICALSHGISDDGAARSTVQRCVLLLCFNLFYGWCPFISRSDFGWFSLKYRSDSQSPRTNELDLHHPFNLLSFSARGQIWVSWSATTFSLV